MEDAPESLSDGTYNDDKEPPKFTVSATIKGFIDRVDKTYWAVRRLQRLSRRLESKANEWQPRQSADKNARIGNLVCFPHEACYHPRMTPEQHAREKALFIRLGRSNNSYYRYRDANPYPEYIGEDGEYMARVDTPELDEHEDDDPECGYNNSGSRTLGSPTPTQTPDNSARRPIADKPPTPGPSNADFDDAQQQPQDTGKGREVGAGSGVWQWGAWEWR